MDHWSSSLFVTTNCCHWQPLDMDLNSKPCCWSKLQTHKKLFKKLLNWALETVMWSNELCGCNGSNLMTVGESVLWRITKELQKLCSTGLSSKTLLGRGEQQWAWIRENSHCFPTLIKQFFDLEITSLLLANARWCWQILRGIHNRHNFNWKWPGD